jgi:hypothetical protein
MRRRYRLHERIFSLLSFRSSLSLSRCWVAAKAIPMCATKQMMCPLSEQPSDRRSTRTKAAQRFGKQTICFSEKLRHANAVAKLFFVWHVRCTSIMSCRLIVFSAHLALDIISFLVHHAREHKPHEVGTIQSFNSMSADFQSIDISDMPRNCSIFDSLNGIVGNFL